MFESIAWGKGRNIKNDSYCFSSFVARPELRAPVAAY